MTTERKLASIQTIMALEPIENADALEKAQVLGWWVVVKKGEHHVGERVIYCEIDSLLPERPEFEFLRKGCFKPERRSATGEIIQPAGFRIKTIKLRGQVSQGICFPLSILPTPGVLLEGDDVTAGLGVSKWDPPLPAEMQGKAKGSFPSFIPKTDETRIQTIPEVLEKHKGELFVVTEKLDGMSFTAFIRDGVFGICSRNLQLDETDDSFLSSLARSMRLKEKLESAAVHHGHDIAIQGEVVGPGVKGNKYRLSEKRLYCFNVFNITTGKYLGHQEAGYALIGMDIPRVPFVCTTRLDHTVDELVSLSEGVSCLCSDTQREGVVIRALSGNRVSFKAINPKFLLKYDE